ncbi:MAG: hypothetical protein K0R03_1459 [Moraxellaceae bacterium]|jgi:uncharacterized protein (TIGR01244 family)|nr:hypothetical protein [Moraxellaceae bacterium]
MNAAPPLWIDIPNACTPSGGICSGGRPRPEHLREARDKGVRTVINLCPPAETGDYDEPALVAELGMRYINIPVAGAAGLTRENAQQLADALRGAGPEHPVLLHCQSGNRVGALVALKARFVDGLSPEAALAAGRAAGLKALEPTVIQLIA